MLDIFSYSKRVEESLSVPILYPQVEESSVWKGIRSNRSCEHRCTKTKMIKMIKKDISSISMVKRQQVSVYKLQGCSKYCLFVFLFLFLFLFSFLLSFVLFSLFVNNSSFLYRYCCLVILFYLCLPILLFFFLFLNICFCFYLVILDSFVFYSIII